MNKFEENIREKRNQFDVAEPMSGHFDRFEQKLDAFDIKKTKTTLYRFGFFQKAAAIVLIMITITIFYNQIDNLNLLKTSQSQELPAELVLATNYYANLNQKKIDKISELSKNDSVNDDILNDVKLETDVLNQNALELKEKYLETKDERVIDAIINNYRVLSELLDLIIYQINESR